MAKVDYGAVALIPVGAYDASRQYHANELVGYQGSSYVALQNPPVGTLPTNTTYFMLHTEGTSIATASTPGTVKPDGTSTVVDANGAMSVKPSLVQAIQDTAESASESASKIGNVPTGKTLQAQIDGLEPRVSSSEQALTVNLLNPRTSSSGEINGLTFRYNGDGTYTVNGEATKDTYFNVNLNPFQLEKTGKFKALGCPLGGSSQSYYAIVTLENGSIIARDFGNGTAAMLEANTNYIVKIGAKNGTVCDNLVFKPMLTTNLSATYDDYVPYSGSSGKLDTDFKTLSEKIGNVGNTDLQSQLNAATQSIAQNTTDIAANAAGISALNTGLTTKTGSLIANAISLNNFEVTSVKQTGNVVNVQFILQNNGATFDIQQFNPCTITGVDLPRDELTIGNAYSSRDKFSCEHACYAVLANDGKIYIKVSTANELWLHVSFTYIV